MVRGISLCVNPPLNTAARSHLFTAIVASISLIALFIAWPALNQINASLGLEGNTAALLVSPSPGDGRTYAICIVNGLRVALISDSRASSATGAVAVNAGSWHDPIPGLAHFLEHSLFLGNARFPGEHAWGAWVAAAGGFSNAFTSQTETNYFYSVDATRAGDAAARFGAFFSSPTLDADALTREVLAVQSEHSKNLRSDAWREWQLLKSSAVEGSPLAAFSTGDRITLRGGANGTRAALAAFFSNHYAAHNMAAALSGPQTIAQLESIARAAFSDVRTKSSSAVKDSSLPNSPLGRENPLDLAAADTAVIAAATRAAAFATPMASFPFPSLPQANPAHASSRGLLFALSPETPTHTLSIIWPISRSRGGIAANADATSLLTTALSDASVGCLLSTLRDADIAESISAGLNLDSPPLGLFSISVTLAPAAVANIASVSKRKGAKAGATVLAALTGTIIDAIARALDVIENAVRISARAELLSSGVGGGGLRDDEIASLNAPALRRDAWDDASVQAALLSAVEREYHHSGDAAENSSVGGVDGDAIYELWVDERDAATSAWRFPARSDASSVVSELASRLASRNLGLKDILLPPMRRTWRAHNVLRLLRQLAPAAAVVQLSSPLVAEVGDVVMPIVIGCESLPLAASAPAVYASAADRSRSPSSAALFERNLCEPIYGTRFAISPLAAFVRAAAASASSPDASLETPVTATLPPRNAYIARTFPRAEHGVIERNVLGLLEGSGEIDISVNAGIKDGGGGDKSFGPDIEPLLLTSVVGSTVWAASGGKNGDAAPPAALWWAPDKTGMMPRAVIGIDVVLPCQFALGSPRAAVLTALGIAVISDSLNAPAAPLRAAGGDIVIVQSGSAGGCGYEIKLRGYAGASLNAAAESLLPMALGAAASSKVTVAGSRSPARAASVALSVNVERACSALLDAPIQRAFAASNEHLKAVPYTRAELLAAAWTLTGAENVPPPPPADIDLSNFAVLNTTTLANELATHWSKLQARILGVTILCAGNLNVTNTIALGEIAIKPLWQAVALARITEENGAWRSRAGEPGSIEFDTAAVAAAVAAAASPLLAISPSSTNAATFAVAALAARTRAAGTRTLSLLASGAHWTAIDPLRAPRETNSAAAIFYEAGASRDSRLCTSIDTCERRTAALTLLGDALSEPAFDSLRTRQALGYVAGAGLRSVRGKSGDQSVVERSYARITLAEVDSSTGHFVKLGFSAAVRGGDSQLSLYGYVQGPTVSAFALTRAVEAFFAPSAAALVNDQERLSRILTSLGSARAAEQREPPIDANDVFERAWSRLAGAPTMDFHALERGAKAAELVKVVDVKEVWENVIAGIGNRRRWSVEVRAAIGDAAGDEGRVGEEGEEE